MTHALLESLTFYDLKACNKISYTEDLVRWLPDGGNWRVDRLCCRSNLLIAHFDLATKSRRRRSTFAVKSKNGGSDCY